VGEELFWNYLQNWRFRKLKKITPKIQSNFKKKLEPKVFSKTRNHTTTQGICGIKRLL
jgi:hypothetical protein